MSALPTSATTRIRVALPTWASSRSASRLRFRSRAWILRRSIRAYRYCPARPKLRCLPLQPSGELGALLVVGANPIAKRDINSAALGNTFLIVQDLFLTETAALADVVFPAASLYEKTGTVTNTFGDVQLARKAADRAGVKSDFEILVRLAGAMGVDVKTLVPFGKGGVTARPRSIAWRTGRRGRSSCSLALGKQSRTKAEPVRSACCSR